MVTFLSRVRSAAHPSVSGVAQAHRPGPAKRERCWASCKTWARCAARCEGVRVARWARTYPGPSFTGEGVRASPWAARASRWAASAGLRAAPWSGGEGGRVDPLPGLSGGGEAVGAVHPAGVIPRRRGPRLRSGRPGCPRCGPGRRKRPGSGQRAPGPAGPGSGEGGRRGPSRWAGGPG